MSQEMERVARVFRELIERAMAGEELTEGFYRGMARDPRGVDPHSVTYREGPRGSYPTASVKHRVYVDPSVIEEAPQSRRVGQEELSPFFSVPVITYRMWDSDLAVASLTGPWHDPRWELKLTLAASSVTTKKAFEYILRAVAPGYGIFQKNYVMHVATPYGAVEWPEGDEITLRFDPQAEGAQAGIY